VLFGTTDRLWVLFVFDGRDSLCEVTDINWRLRAFFEQVLYHVEASTVAEDNAEWDLVFGTGATHLCLHQLD
jgi:hypothetical protein